MNMCRPFVTCREAVFLIFIVITGAHYWRAFYVVLFVFVFVPADVEVVFQVGQPLGLS